MSIRSAPSNSWFLLALLSTASCTLFEQPSDGETPDDLPFVPDPHTGGSGANGGNHSTGGGAGANANSGGTTGSGGAGGSLPDRDPGTPILPDGRGATVHFVTYEAEDGQTNGTVLGPTREIEQVAGEASGRRAVRLDSTGEYVSIQTKSASNSIVVRYSIPDGGQEYWSTLSVFVDGVFRTHLHVTSRYSWTYGDEDAANVPSIHENPASGRPHHFFDEARALIGDVPLGATVEIRKEESDSAAHYDIDLIELENVPPPLSQPPNSISITDCGATPNDNTDDSAAIQDCIQIAEDTGQAVFIPEGTFRTLSAPLSVPGITIVGAGMWYSNISGFHARFDCYEPGCTYRDFAILGDTVHRDDTSPETAFGGNGSSNVVVERVWAEHTKTGYWTGAETNGLRISSCRFRNLMADGVNLYGGTSNSIVENSHFRNTGDDAIAGWAHSPHSTNSNNVFRNNYAQVPWKANCFALYGGTDNTIEGNVCADTVQFPGVLLERGFSSHAFAGTTRITNNAFIRAGGFSFGSAHGAIKLRSHEGALQGVEIENNDIIDATYSAIHIVGGSVIDSVWLTDIRVNNPGDAVFLLAHSAQGALDATSIVATGAQQGVQDDSDGAFTILRHSGNSGW